MGWQESLDEYKKELPPESHELLEDMTAKGKNPASVAAAILWATSSTTQEKAARKFETTDQSLRQYRDLVLYALEIEYDEAKNSCGGTSPRKQAMLKIIDMLDLEEGEDYNHHERYSGESYNLLAPGFVKVADTLEEYLHNSQTVMMNDA